MIVKIKNKEYQINFGIAFVRALDQKYFTKGVGGATFGLGLEATVPKILTGDVTTLADYIYEGTAAEKSRPSQKEVDAFVDSIEDIDAFFDEVVDELKKQNATRRKVLEMTEVLNAQQEKLAK